MWLSMLVLTVPTDISCTCRCEQHTSVVCCWQGKLYYSFSAMAAKLPSSKKYTRATAFIGGKNLHECCSKFKGERSCSLAWRRVHGLLCTDVLIPIGSRGLAGLSASCTRVL